MARQEQIACIFCGKSTIMDRIDWDKFDNWSIEWTVRQMREVLPGPGRGKRGKNPHSGWPAIKEEGLNVLEMAKDPNYEHVVKAIKSRLLKIVKAYISAGIISKEEIIV